MSKGKKKRFQKVGRIFTVGILLSVLYSKTSIANEDSLATRNFSSVLINFLSQFFPALHNLGRDILPKVINDNQSFLNASTLLGKESSSRFRLPSARGKYKNFQFFADNFESFTIVSKPAVDSSYLKFATFTCPSFEPRSQNLDISFSRNERLVPSPSHFYHSVRASLSLQERRCDNFILENIKAIKRDFGNVINEAKEARNKTSFSSYETTLVKPKALSFHLLKKKEENKQNQFLSSINYQYEGQRKLKVESNSERVTELQNKSAVEKMSKRRLENRREETVQAVALPKTMSEMDVLASLLESSKFRPEKLPENKVEKRSEQEIELSVDVTQKPYLEEEVAYHTIKESSPLKETKDSVLWTAGLSSPVRKSLLTLPRKAPKEQTSHHRRLLFTSEFDPAEKESSKDEFVPPTIPMVVRFSQSQLRNDKLSVSHIKELNIALQEKGLKLPKKSGILLALQKLVKDQRLKVSEVHALVARLSEQVNALIKGVYKVTIKEFEAHILHLIQPRHNIETVIDFSKGFKQIAEAVLELWRTKLLTDYIEGGGQQSFKEQPLPTAKQVNSLVDKVIMQRFEQAINPELNLQLKRNATIIIKPTIQNSPLYGKPSMFSTEQKKEILTQVFKLLAVDPSFNLPTFTNSRGNLDIDPDTLKDKIQPYIMLAIGQLYGASQVLALDSSVVQPSNERSESLATSMLSAFSVEEIVKQSDSWLTDKLLELLPGNSQEEKLRFWFNIATQDRILASISLKMNEIRDAKTLNELKDEEEKVRKRTYKGIMKSILIELGSQKFSGSELKSQPALYRDVKRLIKDYLSPNTGFPEVIERTEQALRQPLKKANTALEIHKLINDIVDKKRYAIKARANGTKVYVETPTLEVPKFVFLFSLPYWLALKERLAKREEVNKQKEEKAQLKRQLLVKKLSQLFFKEEIRGSAKSLGQIDDCEKENLPSKLMQTTSSESLEAISSHKRSSKTGSPLLSKKGTSHQDKEKKIETRGYSPLKPIDVNIIAAPPPPPTLQASRAKKASLEIEIRQDLQKLLKKGGLTVNQTSAPLALLVQRKLKNSQASSADIVQEFFSEFKKVFYQVLGVANEKQAYEKFSSRLGIENSGPFVQQLTRHLNGELQSYFLSSLTVKNVESILTFGSQSPDALKRFNNKFTEITKAFLKFHFQAALEQFKIETEHAGKNFETLEVFLNEEVLEPHSAYKSEERPELVLGTFACMLDSIKQNPSFSFPKKEFENTNSQSILDVEAFKPVWVEFLNKVITKKFKGKRPLIKVPSYDEGMKIDPSKVLPYLGELFLTKAFDILPGETRELKISHLLEADSKQSSSLIDDVLESLLLTSYHYQTPANTESMIFFTKHTIKILKEAITERYKGFAASLDGCSRQIIIKSVDPVSLFLDLLKSQLGTEGKTARKHRITMSSTHDRRKKVDTEEVITAFDILLSLPTLWQSKKNIEARKQRAAEEQRLKELAMTHRVQTLQRFIQSEIEI